MDFMHVYNGAILTGAEIEACVACKRIQIEDFDPSRLNPNSYNIRIGNKISTIRPNRSEKYMGSPDPVYDEHGIGMVHSVLMTRTREWVEIDLKEKTELDEHIIPEEGYVLQPGQLYLIPTMERIGTVFYEPIITGRSSIGRLGITVHQTGDFGDIGFSGNWTLQVKVTYPTRIYPYFPMAQIYFLTPHGAIRDLYKGKYHNAKGVMGSKVYEDFKDP